jgi:hypothetical protein
LLCHVFDGEPDVTSPENAILITEEYGGAKSKRGWSAWLISPGTTGDFARHHRRGRR